MSKVIIGVAIAIVVIVGGFVVMNMTVKNDTSGQITDTTNTYTYTIEGEVSKPGTYVLSDAISMSELIDAAGGTTTNTDELSYFEDYVVVPGNTYYIGSKYDASDVCSKTEIKKVNINSDSVNELMEISGITSSIANSIINYRTENGTFNTLEDLLEVYGIGNATYRKIRNYVILHE